MAVKVHPVRELRLKFKLALPCSNCGERGSVARYGYNEHTNWQNVYLCENCLREGLKVFEEVNDGMA